MRGTPDAELPRWALYGRQGAWRAVGTCRTRQLRQRCGAEEGSSARGALRRRHAGGVRPCASCAHPAAVGVRQTFTDTEAADGARIGRCQRGSVQTVISGGARTGACGRSLSRQAPAPRRTCAAARSHDKATHGAVCPREAQQRSHGAARAVRADGALPHLTWAAAVESRGAGGEPIR